MFRDLLSNILFDQKLHIISTVKVRNIFETFNVHGSVHRNNILIYRVSIKCFPDYKHLLQENYVEYKHIFFFKL